MSTTLIKFNRPPKKDGMKVWILGVGSVVDSIYIIPFHMNNDQIKKAYLGE